MSVADKLTTIAENAQKVYEAGKKAQHDLFWDAYQDYGNRNDYGYAFYGALWNDASFKPKYDINIATGQYVFRDCGVTDLKGILESCGVKINSSNATSIYYWFSSMDYNTRLPEIDLSSCTNAQNGFNYSPLLKSIDKIIVSPNAKIMFENAFAYDYALETLIFEGTFTPSGLNLSSSTKLTHESLMSLVNALEDKTGDTSGTQWVCTLGATNLAKLTDSEKAIATEKGWSLV